MNNKNSEANKNTPKESHQININGIDISITFNEKEDQYIKEHILEILSDAYEKKRLGKLLGN